MEYATLVERHRNYRPNKGVFKRLGELTFIAAVGATGSGKTTIINRAIKSNNSLKIVLGDTTRTKRAHETQGEEYDFITMQQCWAKIVSRSYVQWVPLPNGAVYGTSIDNYPKSGIATKAIATKELPVFKSLPLKAFREAFIVPEHYDTWRNEWFNQNSMGELELKGRLVEARQSYRDALEDPDMYFVLNDNLADATSRFLRVVEGEDPNDERRAKALAAKNFKRLQGL